MSRPAQRPGSAKESDLHPAVAAWSEVNGSRKPVTEVEVVSEKEKSAVYRLRGAGPRGGTVIAKRCRPETAAIERRIYEEVLPQLSMLALGYYGALDVPGRDAWLFLEDAPGEPYSPHDLDHRTQAGRWLGALHAGAAPVALLPELPDKGPAWFLARLRLARGAVLARLDAPTLHPGDRPILAAAVEQCDTLEACWGDFETFSETVPWTLVHGDFASLNIRICHSPQGASVHVYDWEKSGYGPPPVDFVRGLDGGAYYGVIGEAWRHVTEEDVARMAAYAKILRPLTHDWSKKPAEKIHNYHVHMAEAMASVGWRDTRVNSARGARR